MLLLKVAGSGKEPKCMGCAMVLIDNIPLTANNHQAPSSRHQLFFSLACVLQTGGLPVVMRSSFALYIGAL